MADLFKAVCVAKCKRIVVGPSTPLRASDMHMDCLKCCLKQLLQLVAENAEICPMSLVLARKRAEVTPCNFQIRRTRACTSRSSPLEW